VIEIQNSIGIAGAGRVARALGRLLVAAGEPVACVASRDLRHAGDAAELLGPDVRAVPYAELPRTVARILIAVPDRAITDVAQILAENSAVKTALHTCGTRGADALAPLQSIGVACGTLHPLQTFTTGAQLRGCAFAIWGDPAAVTWAERIATLAHGDVLRIPCELRPLYHAAAVMTSNYLTALVDAGQTLMQQCGVDPHAALHALGPLLRASLENALAHGPVQALTGPIERGDVETVAAHLTALSAAPPRIRNLYRSAGLHTVDLARRRGLSPDVAGDLDRLLGPNETHGN